MRSSHEVADRIVESIAHIYVRPMMYADTRSGLDAALSFLHGTLAFIERREVELLRIEHEGARSAGRPRGWFTRRKTPDKLQPVIEFWQNIDRRMGFQIPAIEQVATSVPTSN